MICIGRQGGRPPLAERGPGRVYSGGISAGGPQSRWHSVGGLGTLGKLQTLQGG